jgi:hypothetical protein
MFQFDADIEPIDTDIFVGLAEIARPLRGFAEYLFVQLADVGSRRTADETFQFIRLTKLSRVR